MVACGGFDSKSRTTYFFGLTDGAICVRCGCFAGTLDELEFQVKETHGDTSLSHAYIALIKSVKIMMEHERKLK